MKRAVLLDVDGVLLDSFPAFRTVWRSWAQQHELDFEMVWAATHGRRPIDTIREIAKDLDSEVECQKLQTLGDDPGLNFPPIEGAKEFLDSIPAGRWALITSSYAYKVLARFSLAGLPFPNVVVGADDIQVGKPAPDCYRLGAKLLETDPASCVVVEDAPAGVESALAAGAHVVGITTTHSASSLNHAHEIVDNLLGAQLLVKRWFDEES